MATEAPALQKLRAQLNQRYPLRAKHLDGILRDPRIGPPSHHHQGNAIDITHDPGAGVDCGWLAHELVRQMRANPAGGRLLEVIWGRQIATGPRGWVWRPYGRSCPHVKHVHLSLKPSHRDIVRPWSI